MNFAIANVLIFFVFFFLRRVDCDEVDLLDRLKLRFCWTNNVHTILTCSALKEKVNEDVSCIKETDGISCLKLLLNDKADFMVAEPEELILIGLNETENNKLLVTHELADSNNAFVPYMKHPKMVIVASKEIKDFSNAPKKRLCSPGFEWRNYLKYFERSITAQECDPNKTLLENRISSLAEHFDSSCITNVNNYDNEFYKQIQRKYKNIHSACSKLPKNSAPDANVALNCLFQSKGDIVWSKLDDVHDYFKSQMAFEEAAKKFHFICPDGTTNNLTNPSPCIWLQVPWRNIIARRDVAEKVHKILPALNNQIVSVKLYDSSSGNRNTVSKEYQNTPSEYLNRFFFDFHSLNTVSQCKLKRSVNWCVTTDLEARKCDWLSKAARIYGVEPLINCIQESSREECLESMKSKKSEIFLVNTDEIFQAKKNGLKPIANFISRDEDIYNQTAAMVTEKILLSLKSLKDLQNLKACFVGYRDAGWNAFIFMMGELTGDMNWYCNDKEMVSSFFNESCVVGLNEKNRTFPKKLYSFCSKLLPDEKYDAEEKAWSCLDQGADIAFVTYKEEHKIEELPFCVDGEWKNSIFSPEECLLTQKPQASLMVHKSIKQVREDEISLMLQDLQRLFGTPYLRFPTFSLFGHFEGTAGIIFPTNTFRMKLSEELYQRKLSHQAILDELDSQRESCNIMS